MTENISPIPATSGGGRGEGAPQKKKNSSPLIVLLSAVVIGVAVLAQQNSSSGVLVLEELKLPEKPAETLDEAALASWKTYQKEEFGFAIKYPPSLAYKYDSVWTPNSPLIRKTLNSIFEGESFDLTVVVNAPNAQATTSKAKLIREKTVNIDGLTVQNKIFQEPNGDLVSLVGLETNSNFYYAWASIIGEKEASLRTFAQILSTFKFSN